MMILIIMIMVMMMTADPGYVLVDNPVTYQRDIVAADPGCVLVDNADISRSSTNTYILDLQVCL